MKPRRTRNITLALMAMLTGAMLSAEALAANAPSSATKPAAVFAKVGDVVITQQDFAVAMATAMRKKFYHGKVPEGGAAALQREVGDELVTNVLLLGEARRRGLKPDDAAIQQKIQQYDLRYRDNKQWQQARAKLVPVITKQLQEQSLLSTLEKRVRNVPPPDMKQIQAYYAAHPDKFTEPERLQLSVILLKIDPSSPKLVWEKAQKEAQKLVKQLRAGADFAAQARIHSGDSSAAKGGELGYLHHGMLPKAAQEAVDKLKLSEISAPVTLLEGIAIFRLGDRKPARLSGLKIVRKQVRNLWQREQGERAWKSLIVRLKKETPIHVDTSHYLPLPTAAGEHAVKND